MSTALVATVLPRRPDDVAGLLTDPPRGAEFVELRLDALDEPTVAEVRRLLELPRTIPVIATCRSAAQGGMHDGEAAERLALLAEAGERGAELIDVEDNVLADFPASVPGERIASCHMSRFLPRLTALARRVASHGARYAKLAVPAMTPSHLVKLLSLQDEFGPDFAIVPTGRLAEAGRVMAAARGAALSFGAVDAARPGHPDQPTCERLHEIMGVGLVGAATRFYAVVGTPVGHSLSPAFHNTVFRRAGFDRRMVALDVDRLDDVLDHADALGLDGLAVTHPFKIDALARAVSVLPGAEATHSSNTLLRTEAGWQARNTDWRAARDLLPGLIRDWRKAHDLPKDARCRILLLGAGGAARAVAMALVDEHVDLVIWSRRPESSNSLAQALEGVLPATARDTLEGLAADVVVNATPVGMDGVEAEQWTLTSDHFGSGGLAIDLVYAGESSPFRETAEEAGAKLTSGEVFFCLQARRQAELFTRGGATDEVLTAAEEACR